MSQQLAPPSNALALAGFILGCVACGVAVVSPDWLPVVVLSAVPGLLAIIFGFVGITTANRLGGKRRHLAVWSVVLGFCPLVVWVLIRWMLAALFGI